MIGVYLSGRHSAKECRSFWNLYLHPSINKSNWTQEENEKIHQLVQKYKTQNWDAIAAELGTSRTGFQTCIHYFSKLCEKFQKSRFQPEEDDLLLNIIAACRIGNRIPWSKVQYYFQNRSKHQLYHRYRYYLAIDKPINKAPFSMEEDILILCLVNRFGKDFQKVAMYVPNRSGMQIKNRYNCYLENMNTNIGPWTLDEDKRILEGVKTCGRNWSKIAKEINRPRVSVRHRYWVLTQWREKHPDTNFEDVPRKHMVNFIKNHLMQQSKTRQIAEQFKDCESIPTLAMVSKTIRTKKRLKVNIDGPNHSSLLDFFLSTYNPSKKTSKPATTENTTHTTSVISDILKVLNANLDIPDDASLANNSNLDEQDRNILKLLRDQGSSSNASRSTNESIKWLVPPNIETVLGLRGLIMKNSADKNKMVNKDVDLNSDLRTLDVSARAQALHERDLFQQRIYSLFTWPSILSVTEPSESLTSNLAQVQPKVVVKKTVGRPTSYVKKNLAKIEKMLQARKVNKDLSVNVNKTEKTSGIRVKRFADCDNFSKREGLRPRAVKAETETLTPLRQVDFAEVQKAMANRKEPKIFVIANDSSNGIAKKITGSMYIKPFPAGVNVGASTSKECAVVEEENFTSLPKNGFQNVDEMANSEVCDFPVSNFENKSVRTYKRKRKETGDNSEKTKVVKVENEMESLERDISVLESILSEDKKCF